MISELRHEQNMVVLWDDQTGVWNVFRNPCATVATACPTRIVASLDQIENEVVRHGLHAAGFLSYEAAPAFDCALHVQTPAPDGFPLLWFGLYERMERFSPGPASGALPALAWAASIGRRDYHQALLEIREHLRVGNAYQVNFTFRLMAEFGLHPWDFFQAVSQPLPAAHAAYVSLRDWAICSFSPELFFALDDEMVVSAPMKGTRPRGLTLEQDRALAAELSASAKDRAENVMIVDMVRNDLGRIAVPGSVGVDALYCVEKHATVWQMVSRVRARMQRTLIKSGVGQRSLARIFSALFPPASITGAPKAASMKIIAQLEDRPRRIYTGCIGHVGPALDSRRNPGPRARFNVAIRTVLVDRTRKQAEYGVGGGIVWDSDEQGEYAECRAKARVLSQRMPDFALLETLLWTPDQGYALLDRHLHRLRASAEYFDYPLDLEETRSSLIARIEAFADQSHVVRLLLDREGRLKLDHRPPPTAPTSPHRTVLAVTPVQSTSLLLYHKTTHRAVYEQALAQRPGFDDVLLYNEQGQVTESTRANVLAMLDGVLYTPPISCGLLPGTMRAELLALGRIAERVLTPADLARAEQVLLINSIRGMYEVEFVE